jgi:murein DD-endopeptidase MepM/ murein hydrolase activator NlpD
LRPPVVAPVSRPFEAPPCQWCAGHRGITYSVAGGTLVRSAAAGTVTFSGVVVDVRYVVVRHADGLLATYGGLQSTPLSAGDVIGVGAVVGHSGRELYFGLRSGPDQYIDPQPLLGELAVPPYLVPTDGTPRRAPPEPVLRCRPV